MAPILDSNNNQPIIIFDKQSFDSFSNETEEVEEQPVSIWIKEKDVIRPSPNLSILQKLDPGVYTVDISREIGFFCKKIEPISDELFLFSDSIIQSLMSEISMFWDKKDLYNENNLIHKRGILLEGYPGTGKTSIISLLSKEVIDRGGVVFKVSGYRNLDIYIDFLINGFRKIQPDTPIVTILEDIDSYRDAEEMILDFLDGKTNINHHIIISTTNNTESIPDTFLRPSRIDLKIEIPLPCEQTRREYFKFKKVPDADIDQLVEKSNEFSLADLKEFYICIYLLDYSVDDAYTKISSPKDKKNYSISPKRKNSIGI